MDTTSIQVLGVVVHSPVSAGTNVILTLQCLAYYRWLRKRDGERARCWSLFFQMMAVATAAGVAKHGFQPMLGAGGYTLVLAMSNVASGFSTQGAQQATIASFIAPDRRPVLLAMTLIELALFLAANVVMGPDILLLIANTAVGLIPVIVAESRAFRHGSPAGGAVAGGLSLSILTGLAYLGDFSPSPWFDNIDVAHLLMGVSFEIVRRGAAGAPHRSTERPPECAEVVPSPGPRSHEARSAPAQGVPWRV